MINSLHEIVTDFEPMQSDACQNITAEFLWELWQAVLNFGKYSQNKIILKCSLAILYITMLNFIKNPHILCVGEIIAPILSNEQIRIAYEKDPNVLIMELENGIVVIWDKRTEISKLEQMLEQFQIT